MRRAYKIGGSGFVLLTSLCNSLRKIEGVLVHLFNKKKYSRTEDIVKKIHDYELILNMKDKGIQKQLLTNGDRELLATIALRKELKQGDVILEAGANIGYYAIMESKKIGNNGLIYAIEPSRKNYFDLKKNISHNNVKNIDTYHLAFGDKNKMVNLGISNMCNMNRVMENADLRFDETEKVKMVTIDKFLKSKKNPDIVRMDVEGSEYEIFKGMEKLLKNSPPRLLYIETHFKEMGKQRSIEFLTNLKNCGYEIKYAFLYETSTSKFPLLNYLDKKRLQFLSKEKLTINNLLDRKFDMEHSASIEIFFEHKNVKRRKT